MSRDPFDEMMSRNPVPPDQAPMAPMSVADRIVGRGAAHRGWPGWAIAAAAALFVSAVGGGMYWWLGGGGAEVAGSTTTVTSASTTVAPTTTAAPPAQEVVAYFFADSTGPGWSGGPYLIPVEHQTNANDPHAAAVEILLAGPTAEEAAQTPAVSTAIPAGTSLHGMTVSAGIATVDLSSEFTSGGGSASMTGRLAQVVYTLTRFDDVDGVSFLIDGTPTTVFGGEGVTVNDPATRADFEDSLPAVMIETPPWNGAAGSPAVISGTANVFEAVVSLSLTDENGLILWEGTAMASCGTGCRGDWTVSIPYSVDHEQWGSIIAWEASAMDGSQTNVREHRVWLIPSSAAQAEGAVYFLAAGDRDTAQSGPYLIPVARQIDSSDPFTSTMQALLGGPMADESGLSTAIPAGTTLDGVTVAGGIATVDLSSEFTSGGGSFSMSARVAQVIYTLTRFPEVDGVRFLVDGTPTTVFGGEGVMIDDPATRPDDDALLPAVMIESPASGGLGSNPLVVTGTANVFEATVSLSLYSADGSTLFQGFTTATCGTGCRGDWATTIPYTVDTPQWGRLEAFESSAQDGSPINVRTHWVWLTPPGDAGACGSGSTTVPEGAVSRQVVDVDGDGVPDTMWIQTAADGTVRAGIIGSTGAAAERLFDSASPVSRSIMVVDVDGRGPVEVLADDGRAVQLWQFRDCQLVDVLNVQGQPYTFSLGFTDVGDGVDCIDVGGTQQLVGYDVVSDDGTTVEWSYTVVEVGDGVATNGPTTVGTYARPADSAAIDRLRQVSCGVMTMGTDGITAPEP
jgi:spore germination protein GerM